MPDRRRTPRYELGTRLAAHLMPMHDVMVESFSEKCLVVVSLATHLVDEKLMIYLSMADGLEGHRVTVLSSQPVSVAGTMCCRLELRVDAAAAKREEVH